MKTYFSILLLLFIQIVNRGQTTTISLPDTNFTAVSDTIVIPIMVTNFNNVGAISMKIQFDPAVLTFQGITNQAAKIIQNKIGNEIALGWFSNDGTTSLNITSGKLLELKFTFITGTSILYFNPENGQCEISTLNGAVIPATFSNGKVKVSKVTRSN